MAITDEVLQLLREHGFIAESDELERQIQQLSSTDPRERAAAGRRILDMCHPRGLGDLYLERLSLQDWWGKLEVLSKHATRVFRMNSKA